MKTFIKFTKLTLALWVVPFISHADVKLASLFNDYMVLQQNTQARIWGTADAQEKIKITATWTEEIDIVADDNGNWSAKIPTPSGSYIPQAIVIKGKNLVVLKNILIGEVWLCSGQSNMGFALKHSKYSYQEIQDAKQSSIRFYRVPKTMASKPQTNVNARWEQCTPESTPELGAVAYFFGKELLKELDVPIGLIFAYWGASDAQAWIDKKTAANEGFKYIVDWNDENELIQLERRYNYAKAETAWRASQPENPPFDFSAYPERDFVADQHLPFVLFNGMINPIKTYSIKGVIWYQGESNRNKANQYRTLFPAMIKSWRNAWNQGDFPFYYVQIAPYHYNDHNGVISAELRDAQLKTLDVVKNTGMVVTTDIGNINDIHPQNKQEVARRLAMLAFHNDYKKLEGEYTSAVYKSFKVENNKIVVRLDHCEELKIKGKEILGFTIAGKDQVFVKAKAKIVNSKQLEVWAESIKKPVAVRFGWSNALVTNLFNEIGLPVSPFKTDNWKDTTEGNVRLDYP